jgi:hypothetical protein
LEIELATLFIYLFIYFNFGGTHGLPKLDVHLSLKKLGFWCKLRGKNP